MHTKMEICEQFLLRDADMHSAYFAIRQRGWVAVCHSIIRPVLCLNG